MIKRKRQAQPLRQRRGHPRQSAERALLLEVQVQAQEQMQQQLSLPGVLQTSESAGKDVLLLSLLWLSEVHCQSRPQWVRGGLQPYPQPL